MQATCLGVPAADKGQCLTQWFLIPGMLLYLQRWSGRYPYTATCVHRRASYVASGERKQS
jgi:hypothetical protein